MIYYVLELSFEQLWQKAQDTCYFSMDHHFIISKMENIFSIIIVIGLFPF